jgi:hypothetical protein
MMRIATISVPTPGTNARKKPCPFRAARPGKKRRADFGLVSAPRPPIIVGSLFWDTEVPMKINNHTPEPTLVDSRQARAVVGALSMLIRMVGAYTSVGIILQQARSEIVSLVRSEEESQTRAAA